MILQHGIDPITGTGQRHIPEAMLLGFKAQLMLIQIGLWKIILIMNRNHTLCFKLLSLRVELFYRRKVQLLVGFTVFAISIQ